jgi:nitrite reductase/ring-hydroxylating ferredoxin subunit
MSRPYPEGWFRVSDALRREEVRPVRAFGRELVVFRTASGTLSALDAHCPHAGAHLGHGGCVDGEAVRCPFHGLRYAGDGRCLEDTRDRMRLGSWPIREWQGQVMVYASADRRAPEWELPSLPSPLDDWSAPQWRTLRLTGHVQDVAENGVDFRHFETVHRYSNLREPLVEVDGRRLRSRFGFDRRNPVWARLGVVSAVFDTDMWGLGCSITDLRVAPLDLHFRLLLLATQIDERELEFSIGVSVERPQLARGLGRPLFDAGAAGLVRIFHNVIVGDVLQDREIWAHRLHLSQPALTASDEPLVTFRRYAERFYQK